MNNGTAGARRRSRLKRAALSAALGCGLSLSAGTALAQDRRLELGVNAGYLFGTSAEATAEPTTEDATAGGTTKASIASAPSYGATLDLLVRHGAFAEIAYSRSSTELTLREPDGSQYEYDLLAQYLQIGGLLEFRTPSNDWFRPIFGGTLGATIYSADDGQFSYEEGHFSMIFEGGAKIRLASFLGLRLRARLLGTFLTDDSALFCAGGTCAYAYSGTLLLQAELGAGAYVAF